MVFSLRFGNDLNVFYAYLLAVLLNSAQIFEKIFGDELIMDILGCLECKCFFTPKVYMPFLLLSFAYKSTFF